MPQLIICPSCRKTVQIERTDKTCPDCGQPVDILTARKQGLLVDQVVEGREFEAGKDYFRNSEFLSASQRFKKALDANKNSYLSLYFVELCEIYLNDESTTYDIMAQVINTIKKPLDIMQYSAASVNDKLAFITAMLNETKIIIINRLRSHDELFELDINKYRSGVLSDLNKLSQLFKIDGELLMTYSPVVQATLLDVADAALAACQKAVQTVAVGEELYSPSDAEYRNIVSLNNDYSYYASSLSPDYDVKKYQPDFTQNDLLNDKVIDRFNKFDAKNRQNAKKHIICDEGEYRDILSECEKALDFTYTTCFRSLCDEKNGDRTRLAKTGISFITRSLTPVITASDKKKAEVKVEKFVFIAEKCARLSEFLEICGEAYACAALREYYGTMCDIFDMYFVSEYEHQTKNVNRMKQNNGEELKNYERFLFNAACAASPALSAYVPQVESKDKFRTKLVKYCKTAAEEFLMLRDYRISGIEQSNIYRPILDIYNAVMDEVK